MLSGNAYIQVSIEANLFWTRIMKEHAIFIEATMPPTLAHVAQQANNYKRQYSVQLAETIRLSGGVIPKSTLESAQFYTRFTEAAEQNVQYFTGIETDSDLTQMEYDIVPQGEAQVEPQTEDAVRQLNANILALTNSYVDFKKALMENRMACNIFTLLYPSDYVHILHEAQRYAAVLKGLETGENVSRENYAKFWNINMSQHAADMRGLFDPSESAFIEEANRYAVVFNALSQVPAATTALPETQGISAFKDTATSGMLSCKIKTIMNPLFTDHMAREANHYIWQMQQA